MKKVIKLTESELNKLVKRIAEDFDDEWDEKKPELRFPLEKGLEILKSPLSNKEKIEKFHSEPEWKTYQDNREKHEEYMSQKRKAYSEYEPSEEVKKLHEILNIPIHERKYYKTKKEMISYITRMEKSLIEAKNILGI